MKYTQLKHTAKLKRKQPTKIMNLARLLIGIMPLACLLAIKTTLNNLLVQDISIPTTIYIIVIAFPIVNTLVHWLLGSWSPFKLQRIKNTLKKVIEVNGFYYENADTGKITLSMIIKFYKIDDNLHLEVYPCGGKFSNKLNDLTPIFQTALNLTVISVQDDHPNHTTYILKDNVSNVIEFDNWSFE